MSVSHPHPSPYTSARVDRFRPESSRDHDVHKGAIENGSPSDATNAPGLDGEGLPNDETAILQDSLGAREDGSQG